MEISVDIAGNLFPNPTTMIVQLLSTAVLCFFFYKFLYHPLRDFMARRAAFIEGNLNEAKEINEQAKVHIKKSEELARQGAIEYKEIVERAKEDGNTARQTIIEDAKKEATDKINQANRSIENEKAKAKDEMRQEIVDIALEAAKKILDKEIDEESNITLINDFIREVNKDE